MNFEQHAAHVKLAIRHLDRGDYDAALAELDTALELDDTPHARWDRALTLFGLGRYHDAREDFEHRWNLFVHGVDERGRQLLRDLPRWRGERLTGKRLVVIHEGGFGDTIMLLRYVHQIRGAVALHMPKELERLAQQFAPLVGEIGEQDVCCTTFDLMLLLQPPSPGPLFASYIWPDPVLQKKWQLRFWDGKPTVGITWSSQRNNNREREVALELLLDHVLGDCRIISLQTHDTEQAQAHGVLVPGVEDFADLAALISVLDRVISIDTAALHVAGAIGHRATSAILPFTSCWRWHIGNHWYPNIKLCRQQALGDWASVFAQL
jgi:hypothetical protein